MSRSRQRPVLRFECDVCGRLVGEANLDESGRLAVGGFPGPADSWLMGLGVDRYRSVGSRPHVQLMSHAADRAVVRCRCGATHALEVDRICLAYDSGRRGRVLVSEVM